MNSGVHNFLSAVERLNKLQENSLLFEDLKPLPVRYSSRPRSPAPVPESPTPNNASRDSLPVEYFQSAGGGFQGSCAFSTDHSSDFDIDELIWLDTDPDD